MAPENYAVWHLHILKTSNVSHGEVRQLPCYTQRSNFVIFFFCKNDGRRHEKEVRNEWINKQRNEWSPNKLQQNRNAHSLVFTVAPLQSRCWYSTPAPSDSRPRQSLRSLVCVCADSGALALRFAGIHHANPRHTVSRRGFTAYPGTPSAAEQGFDSPRHRKKKKKNENIRDSLEFFRSGRGDEQAPQDVHRQFTVDDMDLLQTIRAKGGLFCWLSAAKRRHFQSSSLPPNHNIIIFFINDRISSQPRSQSDESTTLPC